MQKLQNKQNLHNEAKYAEYENKQKFPSPNIFLILLHLERVIQETNVWRDDF